MPWLINGGLDIDIDTNCLLYIDAKYHSVGLVSTTMITGLLQQTWNAHQCLINAGPTSNSAANFGWALDERLVFDERQIFDFVQMCIASLDQAVATY